MSKQTAEDTPLLREDKKAQWESYLNPIGALHDFIVGISDAFTWQFTVLLASAYVGIKGVVMTMVGLGQVPLYKTFFGLQAGSFQSLKTIASTPWACKALMGALSDSYPLLGYRKRSYILLSAFLGLFSLIMVTLLPREQEYAKIAAILFLLINLFVATTDLLLEGKYAEEMRNKPETGSSLVSWVWGLVMFGTLLGSCIGGPVSEMGNPKVVFLICIPFCLQIFFPLFAGWLPEDFVPRGERHLRTDKFHRQPRLFLLGFFVAGGALLLAVIGELAGALTQLVVSLSVSLIACILAFLWLPKVLANAIVYMFVSQVLYIQIDGATTYFFLATKEQLPNGPHFSNIYFFTYTAVVGAIAGMLGVTLFQAVLSKTRFRTAFWTTTLIQCFAATIDVTIVKRWNEEVLGVPDAWFYMLGDAMIGGVISMMNFMPSIVLTSKVCPKGVESLVYALLAGFQNFGGTVASYTGAYLIEIAGIKTDPAHLPWDFDALPTLLVVCHMLLPLLAVPLTFVLIPDAKMTDEFVFDELNAPDDENNDSVEGGAVVGGNKITPHEA